MIFSPIKLGPVVASPPYTEGEFYSVEKRNVAVEVRMMIMLTRMIVRMIMEMMTTMITTMMTMLIVMIMMVAVTYRERPS